MTTITASEYSPNITAQPLLNPLRPGQVALLNRGAANDISPRVRTIVQRHLGYQGTDVFRATFTRQEITFTLRNGPATENRTLRFENNHWMLSQDTAPAAPLNPAVEEQVTTLVTEILDNIGRASNTNAPDPAPAADPAAAVVGADQPAAAANNAELIEIRAHLVALEAQLRANPTLEQSLRIQQEILREVALLRASLERHPQVNNAEENDALRSRVQDLQGSLDRAVERLRALDTELRDSQTFQERQSAVFDELQARLGETRRELARQQQAHGEKDQAALALQRRVADLEAAVSQKDAEQRRTREESDAFKAQKESIQRQLQAQCESTVRAAEEAAVKSEKARADAIEHSNRGVAALREQVAQKADLEQQLIAVRSELSHLQQTNQKALAEASSQLEALRAQKTSLERTLAASSSEAHSANAQLSQRIGELEKQIQTQQVQLASDERLNQSQAALIATQEQQLQELEALLRSTEEDAGSTIASLQAQNRQLEDALAQLQQTLEAAQSKNASELAAATSALQSLKTTHAQQLQNKNEAIQLLQAELNGLKQLLEGSNIALQDQIASTKQEMDTHSKKNQALLQSLQLLDTNHADQVRGLESTLAEKQRALEAEQQKAKSMKANFKEELASQVKAVEAIQAEKDALQTRFDRERQNLIREKDEALQVGKTSEARIKVLEEELRAIQQRLQEMLRTKQEAVAAATRTFQDETRNTAAVDREIAALEALVQPGVRIAAAGRNTAAVDLEIAARAAPVPARIAASIQSLLK